MHDPLGPDSGRYCTAGIGTQDRTRDHALSDHLGDIRRLAANPTRLPVIRAERIGPITKRQTGQCGAHTVPGSSKTRWVKRDSAVRCTPICAGAQGTLGPSVNTLSPGQHICNAGAVALAAHSSAH
jgi:hypothetical protein